MTIVAVGVCVDGKVRHDGYWAEPGTGKRHYGISSPMPCEKCDGKGCPKPAPDAENATG